jgi:hypothetical protein
MQLLKLLLYKSAQIKKGQLLLHSLRLIPLSRSKLNEKYL